MRSRPTDRSHLKLLELLPRMNFSKTTTRMKPSTNKPKRKQKRPSRWRLIRLATHGGLDRIRGGITAAQLARVRCLDGYTALHYAARYGHLDEIKGGVTLAQLTRVTSDFDWILEFNVTTKPSSQIFSGSSALSVAISYGHLDQICGNIALAELRASRDTVNRTMMQILEELISKGEDPIALGNNIAACPEILGLLSAENKTHVAAVRHAMSRYRELESLLHAEMTAALL